MKQAIVTDIFGTITPNSFIKPLMTDFRKNGAAYVGRASPEALQILDQIRQESGLETPEKLIGYIADQIDQRSLRPDYLAWLGFVNANGYDTGTLQGEFFPDVRGAFQNWKQNGKGIFVYSNGSEKSQEAMFKAAKGGDLSPYVSRFFDTARVGLKHEADSYRRISDEIGTAPQDMLFLSDLEAELEGADKAGLHVKLVLREGNKPVQNPGRYQSVRSFEQI